MMEYRKARFEITAKCDLACKHCYRSSYGKWTLWKDMSTEEIKHILDYLVDKWLKKVKLLWGEVLIRDDYIEILEYCTDKWLDIFLISNGLALTEDVLERIKDTNITLLSISIEWPKAVNNKIRWYDMDYDKLVRNIKNAAKYFPTCIGVTVQKENIDHLEEIFRMFAGSWIKYIHLPVFMARTQKEIQESEALLGEPIRLLPHTWCEYLREEWYIQKNLNLFERLKRYKEKYGIDYSVTPLVPEEAFDQLYRKGMRDKYTLDCVFLNQIILNNDWDVHLCPFIRIKLGNIKEDSLEKIYDNDRYKKMIDVIHEKNLLPVCERCCWIRVV